MYVLVKMTFEDHSRSPLIAYNYIRRVLLTSAVA